MARISILFLYALRHSACVDARDLSDFSNDLATDIGPLLTLVGDSITKQYLSESTMSLDYLIFALAPIGIVTAVVSAIRVCGHSSLRAFVGRSQEGQGAIEAELCTSTSRDVCELFTRGGIARVLGVPSILELVYTPDSKEPRTDSASCHTGSDTDFDDHCIDTPNFDGVGPEANGGSEARVRSETHAKIYLSRNYFDFGKNDPEITRSDWEEVDGPLFEKKMPSERRASPKDFGPNPNLSLNVGIIKRGTWVFLSVALVGMVLQVGVLAMAGTFVWRSPKSLDDDEDSKSSDYAPIMFIAGTLLMAFGTGFCAFLIGQATREVRFRRQPRDSGASSRLLWLQPGPQVIGDQSFDPCAYLEDTEKTPLTSWTSSRKENKTSRQKANFQIFTCIATASVLIGYVMQFIGLRGMTAWVSIAQLGASLVMSILRSCLRAQRISSKANELKKMPDTVSGHELDWLSYKITQHSAELHFQGLAKTTTPRATPNSRPGGEGKTTPLIEQDMTAVDHISTDGTANSPPCTERRGGVVSQSSVNELLRVRVRLAHLTGHTSLSGLPASEYQRWNEGRVKVRRKAHQISAAICAAMPALLPNMWDKGGGERNLQVQLPYFSADGSARPGRHFRVVLEPPPEVSQTGWRVNSAQIEAILGLWVWSMISRQLESGEEDESLEFVKSDVNTLWAKIISGSMVRDDECLSPGSIASGRVEKDIGLWFGTNEARFSARTLTFDPQTDVSLATLWHPVRKADEDMWTTTDKLGNEVGLRVSGWCSVDEVEASLRQQSGGGSGRLRVNVTQLRCEETSLLDVCCQELYSAITMSLCEQIDPEKSPIRVVETAARMENPMVKALADQFVENGLGSFSDAIICIVPALRKHLYPENTDQMLLDTAGDNSGLAVARTNETGPRS